MEDTKQIADCARRLRALADAERLRIVRHLLHGPKNVSELAGLMGSPVVNVSHHLGVLKNSNLVLDEKHGRFVVYRLNPDVHQSSAATIPSEYLSLGCCRLELPRD